MNPSFNALVMACLLVAANAAFGQITTPAGMKGPFGQACGADMANYCASAQSREERRSCIEQNKDKFSDTCKNFMASHHMHHHGGQSSDGGE